MKLIILISTFKGTKTGTIENINSVYIDWRQCKVKGRLQGELVW